MLGILNIGVDLLSWGNPLYGEWRGGGACLAEVWPSSRRSISSQENAQCPLFFSLSDVNAPLGVDVLAHP